MRSSQAVEVLERFIEKPWKFEQTVKTPLKDLPAFVAAIISNAGPAGATLVIDEVVFEPGQFIDTLARYSMPPTYGRGFCVMAESQPEVEELLRSTLAEWIDFLFIFEPQSLAIYADHDEFATFYAHTRADLDSVIEPLSRQGFELITDWKRTFRRH